LRLGRAGGGHAFGPLSAWLLWEALTSRRWRRHRVRAGGLTRYRVLTYMGDTVALADGTRIRPGDRIIDLHLDNHAIARRFERSPWLALQVGVADLQMLDAWIRDGRFGPIRALRGVTLLVTVGRRLGFEVRPLKWSWQTWMRRYFLVGLEAVYHPGGLARLDRHPERRWPAELWMSAAALHGYVEELVVGREPERVGQG
jgi:hypothetical protein